MMPPCRLRRRKRLMNPSIDLVNRFYAAFAQRDWRTMAACYHPDVHFSDEVFDLHGRDAGEMWHMLAERGRDLTLQWRDVHERADGSVTAHWDAHYTFSATGRAVHNAIDAQFTLRDGLIVRHVDRFDFWRWSRQALGVPGWLLGWTPLLKAKVRAQAAKGLAAFRRDADAGADTMA
jgi:ketosteroid isomerase-like protein